MDLGLELTRGLGAIMVLAGVPGLVDAFARFALQRLGTLAPIAPTRNLVVTGLYRYVRNPIYVAVVAIILGQALLMGEWRLIVYGMLASSAESLSTNVRQSNATRFIAATDSNSRHLSALWTNLAELN
jgi:protein-S-isoprenylcysteine O-methyltransferase Ste14